MTTSAAEDFKDEDASQMSLIDIYNHLLAHSEIILTIPRTEEKRIRQGLASVKGKQNAKLKDAGFAPDNTALSFQVVDNAENPKENIDIKIKLGKRTTIKVLSMKLPDTEI